MYKKEDIMKHETRPLTPEIKRQVDDWFNSNFNELVRQAQVYLRAYGHYRVEPYELVSKLYEVLVDYAYGPGWADDEAILKQSKRRLLGYAQDLHTKAKPHESVDQIVDDHEELGTALPQQFVVDTEPADHMLSSKVAEVRDSICESPYDYALVDVLMGDATCSEIGREYGLDRSTVSKHKDLLKRQLQEQMLKLGV
jgi:hypothetical protein